MSAIGKILHSSQLWNDMINGKGLLASLGIVGLCRGPVNAGLVLFGMESTGETLLRVWWLVVNERIISKIFTSLLASTGTIILTRALRMAGGDQLTQQMTAVDSTLQFFRNNCLPVKIAEGEEPKMLRSSQRLFGSEQTKRVLKSYFTTTLHYSKGPGAETPSIYKVVKSGTSAESDDLGNLSGIHPNWELLTPEGYRFYLPGSVGLAWHDPSTVGQLDDLNGLLSEGPQSKSDENALECTANECPLLLRKGVLEMFPGMKDLGGTALTIVTLSQKSDHPPPKDFLDPGRENQVRNFVLAAQEICTKIKLAGYWADFINPFSGLPYLDPSTNKNLFKTDERFRCLGFEIIDFNDCKVIGSQQNAAENFVGSLFTTAPANMRLLKSILNQYH